MSAHHYFRDFALPRQRDDPVAAGGGAVVPENTSLKALVADRQAAFPASGEINRKLNHAAEAIARIRERYASQRPQLSIQQTASVLNILSGVLTCAVRIPSRWCA